MDGVPFYYDYINSEVSRVTPNTIHSQNTGMTRFFTRYLLQKAFSVFEWKLPETWAKNYFLYTLYCWGFVAVVNTDKFGVVPQSCGLQGYDVMYQPTHAVISNPLLRGIVRPRIDKECTVIKLQPDYGSIMDMVSFYADMMSLSAETAGINLFNSKLSYVFGAGSRAGAESLKKLYDEISSGNPACFYDKSLLNDDGTKAWDLFSQNVGQNYIADKVLADMRKWELMFLSQIGIPNANTDKKERLITSEVESNDFEVKSLASIWLEELQKSCEKASEMFRIELSVDWRNKEVMIDERKPIDTGLI